MSLALVTGATGFIGSHVVELLRARGTRVRCLVRATSKTRHLQAPGVSFAQGDLGNPRSLELALRDVDEVYHLAAMLKMPWRHDFESVNVGGSRALAAACAAQPTPPRLVVVSTMAAVGPVASDCEVPRPEHAPGAPVSIYGAVKRKAELAMADYRMTVPMSIVRPPMVFGERDYGTLRLFKMVGRGLLTVPGGEVRRISLIHARDLAELLLLIAEKGRPLPEGTVAEGPGVYHAAMNEHPTQAGLGRLIHQAMGRKGRLRVLRLPPAIVWTAATISEWIARLRDKPTVLSRDKVREITGGNWMCDASKAERELGFSFSVPLDERLAQTAAWYREQGMI